MSAAGHFENKDDRVERNLESARFTRENEQLERERAPDEITRRQADVARRMAERIPNVVREMAERIAEQNRIERNRRVKKFFQHSSAAAAAVAAYFYEAVSQAVMDLLFPDAALLRQQFMASCGEQSSQTACFGLLLQAIKEKRIDWAGALALFKKQNSQYLKTDPKLLKLGAEFLVFAASKGEMAIVKMLVNSGVPVDLLYEDANLYQVLIQAIKDKHLDWPGILALFSKQNFQHLQAAPDFIDLGAELLVYAAAKGETVAVKMLANAGIPVDRGLYEGRTALRHALERQDADMVDSLLAHNADVHANQDPTKFGNGPFFEDLNTPLSYAISKSRGNSGYIFYLKKLLKSQTLKMKDIYQGVNIPLLWMSDCGKDISEALLDAGAPVDGLAPPQYSRINIRLLTFLMNRLNLVIGPWLITFLEESLLQAVNQQRVINWLNKDDPENAAARRNWRAEELKPLLNTTFFKLNIDNPKLEGFKTLGYVDNSTYEAIEQEKLQAAEALVAAKAAQTSAATQTSVEKVDSLTQQTEQAEMQQSSSAVKKSTLVELPIKWASRLLEGVVNAIGNFAQELPTNCPSYFNPTAPTYWQNSTHGLFFNSSAMELPGSTAALVTYSPGLMLG